MSEADIALLQREAGWNHQRQLPAVAPGTFEEEAALDAIRQARLEERAELGDSFAKRRLRQQRHFRLSRDI